MKKGILILFILSAIAMFGYSLSEAFSGAVSPVTPLNPSVNRDNLETFNRFDLGCSFDHATVVFNNTDGTAMGVILDDNGDPDSTCLNFAYVAADFVGGTFIWVSTDGINWFCATPPCHP